MPSIFTTEPVQLRREFSECIAEVHQKRVEAEKLKFDVIEKQETSPDANQRGYRLYQIKELLMQCNALAEIDAEANDGVINDDLAKQLDQLEMARNVKALAICKLIKNLENRNDGFEKAIKAMQARQKTCKNDAKRLLNYLTLNIAEGECFEDPEIKLSWSTKTGTDIFDEDLIPDTHCSFSLEIAYTEDEKETIELMKTKAKENPYSKFSRTPLVRDKIAPDIKKGIVVPGAKKVEGKRIVIK